MIAAVMSWTVGWRRGVANCFGIGRQESGILRGSGRMVVRKTAIALALMLGYSGAASAGPALLFDAANGRVLYAEDQDQPWHPASLTKIMTAYLVFEALKTNAI